MLPKQNQRYLVKVGRWQHQPQTPQILCGPAAAGGAAVTQKPSQEETDSKFVHESSVQMSSTSMLEPHVQCVLIKNRPDGRDYVNTLTLAPAGRPDRKKGASTRFFCSFE